MHQADTLSLDQQQDPTVHSLRSSTVFMNFQDEADAS